MLFSKLEVADQFGQVVRPCVHRFGGRRRLLDQCRVLLGNSVQLDDRAVDLPDASLLFRACVTDPGHDRCHALNAEHDVVHRRAGDGGQPASGFDPGA